MAAKYREFRDQERKQARRHWKQGDYEETIRYASASRVYNAWIYGDDEQKLACENLYDMCLQLKALNALDNRQQTVRSILEKTKPLIVGATEYLKRVSMDLPVSSKQSFLTRVQALEDILQIAVQENEQDLAHNMYEHIATILAGVFGQRHSQVRKFEDRVQETLQTTTATNKTSIQNPALARVRRDSASSSLSVSDGESTSACGVSTDLMTNQSSPHSLGALSVSPRYDNLMHGSSVSGSTSNSFSTWENRTEADRKFKTGLAMLRRGETDNAIELLENAKRLYLEANFDQKDMYVSRVEMTLGKSFLHKGENQDALACFKEAYSRRYRHFGSAEKSRHTNEALGYINAIRAQREFSRLPRDTNPSIVYSVDEFGERNADGNGIANDGVNKRVVPSSENVSQDTAISRQVHLTPVDNQGPVGNGSPKHVNDSDSRPDMPDGPIHKQPLSTAVSKVDASKMNTRACSQTKKDEIIGPNPDVSMEISVYLPNKSNSVKSMRGNSITGSSIIPFPNSSPDITTKGVTSPACSESHQVLTRQDTINFERGDDHRQRVSEDISCWNTNDVRNFLVSSNLPSYVDSFTRQGITGEDLLEIFENSGNDTEQVSLKDGRVSSIGEAVLIDDLGMQEDVDRDMFFHSLEQFLARKANRSGLKSATEEPRVVSYPEQWDSGVPGGDRLSISSSRANKEPVEPSYTTSAAEVITTNVFTESLNAPMNSWIDIEHELDRVLEAAASSGTDPNLKDWVQQLQQAAQNLASSDLEETLKSLKDVKSSIFTNVEENTDDLCTTTVDHSVSASMSSSSARSSPTDIVGSPQRHAAMPVDSKDANGKQVMERCHEASLSSASVKESLVETVESAEEGNLGEAANDSVGTFSQAGSVDTVQQQSDLLKPGKSVESQILDDMDCAGNPPTTSGGDIDKDQSITNDNESVVLTVSLTTTTALNDHASNEEAGERFQEDGFYRDRPATTLHDHASNEKTGDCFQEDGSCSDSTTTVADDHASNKESGDQFQEDTPYRDSTSMVSEKGVTSASAGMTISSLSLKENQLSMVETPALENDARKTVPGPFIVNEGDFASTDQSTKIIVETPGRHKIVGLDGHDLWRNVTVRLQTLGVFCALQKKRLYSRFYLKCLSVGYIINELKQHVQRRRSLKLFLTGFLCIQPRHRVARKLYVTVFTLGFLATVTKWEHKRLEKARMQALIKARDKQAKAHGNKGKYRGVHWDILDDIKGTIWDEPTKVPGRTGNSRSDKSEKARELAQLLGLETQLAKYLFESSEDTPDSTDVDALVQGKSVQHKVIQQLFPDLHEQFGGKSQSRNANPSGNSSQTKGQKRKVKDKAPTIFDSTTAQNMNIALAKVKMSFEELKHNIERADLPSLGGVDTVHLLYNLNAYSPETTSKVREYVEEKIQELKEQGLSDEELENKAVQQLDMAEQYVWKVSSKVQFVREKLHALTYMGKFNDSLAVQQYNLELLRAACDEILGSLKFSSLLRDVLLPIGNKLNEGTRRGVAVGFKLSTLKTLCQTKANNEMNLLEYVLDKLDSRKSAIIDLEDDFQNLESASKLSLSNVQADMRELGNGMKTLENIRFKLKQHSDQNNSFLEVLEDFLSSHKPKCEEAMNNLRAVEKLFNDVMVYLGEKSSSNISSDDLFGQLLEFLDIFRQSLNSIRKRRQKQMREKKAKSPGSMRRIKSSFEVVKSQHKLNSSNKEQSKKTVRIEGESQGDDPETNRLLRQETASFLKSRTSKSLRSVREQDFNVKKTERSDTDLDEAKPVANPDSLFSEDTDAGDQSARQHVTSLTPPKPASPPPPWGQEILRRRQKNKVRPNSSRPLLRTQTDSNMGQTVDVSVPYEDKASQHQGMTSRTKSKRVTIRPPDSPPPPIGSDASAESQGGSASSTVPEHDIFNSRVDEESVDSSSASSSRVVQET